MKPDDAKVLLQSTQQLRIHWSGVITTHVGYAIAINVGIWSYFLKAYIDSSFEPFYIGIATAVSSIILGLWRLYTRYVDNHIAGLYPDFLLYEGILSVPTNRGTSGYLMRAVPKVRTILSNSNLKPEQKLEAISTLVKLKRIGRRGHLWFDLSVGLVILMMLGVSLFLLADVLQSAITIVCLVGVGIGLCLTIFEFFFYQREPATELVERTVAGVKRHELGHETD